MNTVIRHIEYLLLRNDCVIIPELGAILAKRESAKFDPKTNVIAPPRRVFTFNDSIRIDDKSLLSSSIARALNIEKSEADKIIANDVRVIKNHIFRRGILKIGNTGSILIDENTEHIYFFESQTFSSTCSMWLQPVTASSNPAKVIESPIEHGTWSWTGIKRIARAAASIAILIGICFLASTPLHIDDVMMASLAPELKPVENVDLIPQQDIIDDNQPDAIDVNLSSRADIQAENSDVKSTKTNADIAGNDKVADSDIVATKAEKTYHLIVATFTNKAQADSYIANNPGINYQVIGNPKIFRISVSSHSTKDDAVKACSAAQSQYPGAWVYSE